MKGTSADGVGDEQRRRHAAPKGLPAAVAAARHTFPRDNDAVAAAAVQSGVGLQSVGQMHWQPPTARDFSPPAHGLRPSSPGRPLALYWQ